MPRRKAAERTQPHKSRSRNGCLTCRRRKIRCDEAKPACSNCCSKGLDCQWGVALKWEAEYTSRGLAFGRCGVWSKHGSPPDDPSSLLSASVNWLPLPPIRPYHFVNSTVDGFEDSLAEQEESSLSPASGDALVRALERPGSSASSASAFDLGRQLLPLKLESGPSPRSPIASLDYPVALLHSPRDFPQLEDSTYAPLLSYYLERLCPLTTPSVLSKSPFASLILPFSVSASSNALNAVLALSARHLSKVNRSWKPAAMQLEGKVLHALRRRLMTEDPVRVALDPEVPTIMMMLCLYEIINKCDERWVIHLRGARDLIRARRKLLTNGASGASNDLLNFSERFFAYQDVIGRTACGEVPIFGSDYWDVEDREADVWLGCSPELVSIVCSITELSRLRRVDRPAASEPDFDIKAEALESRLSDLRQVVRDPADGFLRRSAEVKRLAAVVYLYCALHGATPTTPLVADHVREILKHMLSFVEQGVAAGLLWPLFVAAVELDPVQDELWTDAETSKPVYGRPLVLRAFDHMAQSSIANVSRARAVVNKVWQARECEVSGSPHSATHKADELNDWERLVGPVSGNMSLA